MKVEFYTKNGDVKVIEVFQANSSPLNIDNIIKQLAIHQPIAGVYPSGTELSIVFADGLFIKIPNAFGSTADTGKSEYFIIHDQVFTRADFSSASMIPVIDQPIIESALISFDGLQISKVIFSDSFASLPKNIMIFMAQNDEIIPATASTPTAATLEAYADNYAITEDQIALGNLLVNDHNAAQAVPQIYVTPLGAQVNLDAAGFFIYNPLASAPLQALRAGQNTTETLTYSMLDTNGNPHQAQVIVAVTGVNDLPTITGGTTGATVEDTTLLATGSLSITDVDTGEAAFQAGTITGTYGDLVIDATGAWSYNLRNTDTAVQNLNASSTVQDVLNVQSIDGTVQQITVDVTGIDEATFSVSDPTISEATGSLIFTITKAGVTLQSAAVNYTTNDGSAASSTDYTAAAGTVIFTAGQTQALVTIAVTNDAVFEGTETLTLNLTTPVNATISDAQGIGTINNDDAAPTLAVSDTTVNEEDGVAILTVTKTGASAVATTVNYTTTNASATSANDYITNSGTLTFTAGQTQILVTVAISNDAVFENNETLTVDLSGAVNGTITDGQGIITIADNTDVPSIAVGDVTVSEAAAAIIFTLTKTGTTLQPATVNYTTNDGSATNSNDYTTASGTVTFTAGQTQALVTIAVTNDGIFEGTETLTLDLATPVNATISDAQGIGTITNDDATVTLSVSDATVNEEDGVAILTVTKAGTTAVATTVNYTTNNASATSANDYVTNSGTLTFTAGQTQILVTVAISNDAVFENNETLTFDLSGAVNGTIADGQGVITIADNADLPSIAINDVTVSEAAAAIIFTLTKTGTTLQPATVNYTTNDGSATNSNDYTTASGTVTFTAGQTQALVTIAVTNDAVFEGTETLTLDLATPVNATISDAQGIGTLTNDDAAPTLAVSDAAINEEDGVAVLTVTKTGASAVATTVNYTTANGSATSANDYVTNSGTLTFTAGQTQILVTVAISNDGVFENNETLTLDLSGAVNGTITDGQGIITIADNADLPSIAVNDVTVSEAAGAIIYTLIKTGTTLQPATVNYTTNDGSATNSNDYTTASGTVTFTAGQTQALVTIAVTNDGAFEVAETFSLDLSGAVNATISDAQAIGTINDDDAIVGFTINDIAITEQAGVAVLTVTKSGTSAVTSSLSYATTNGSATNAADYATNNGFLTFTAGQTQNFITVTISNDAIYEGDETFVVNLFAAVNATVVDNQGIVTITDNADLPSIAINDVTVSEAAAAVIFTLTKTGTTLQPATVNYTTNDGSATNSNDYTTASGTVTFTAGQTQALVTIAVTNDAIFEGTETLTLDLATPVNATISDAQGIGTLTNDDAAPTLAVSDAAINEEDGVAILTVTKTGASAVATTVNYTTTNGSATSANDYVTNSGTLTFTAGQTQILVTIAISNDGVFENNETLTFDLSGAVNGTIADGQGVITIADNADLPSIAINDVTVSEAAAAIIFTLVKTGTTLQAATVNYTTNDGSATNSNDYTTASGTVTFTAGQTQALVTIAVTNDAIFEGTETLTLDLATPVNATISDAQGIGTLTNDDATPTLAVSDAVINEEDGVAILTVTKTGASAVATTVNYTTTNGSATSANDYVTNSGILTFTAGQTQILVTIAISNDGVFENNETLTFDLSGAVNGTITDSQGLITIADNADLPSIAVNDVTVSEAAAAIIFTLTKTGTTLQPATVNYTTNDGSATNSNDYTTASGTVTFTAGQTQALVTIAVTNDAIFEGTETFTLDLAVPVNATISDAQGVGTITNDDATVNLSVSDATVNEETGVAILTVTKAGVSAVATTVNYTTTNGTATSANDYITNSGTLTFTAGQTQILVTVAISNDAVFENNETLTFDLSGAVNGTIADGQGVITIADNADLPTIAVNDATVSEAAAAVIFTLTKTGTTLQPATVNYTSNDGSATSSNDYTTASGTVTFTAGQTQALVTIAVTNDAIFEGTETLTLDLATPVNATISDAQGIGTLTNDDAAPTLAVSDAAINEEDGVAILTVTKTGASAVATTVNYTTTNGSATSANDYVTNSGTLTFTAGQTQILVTIAISNDAVFENNETLTFDLSGAVNGTIADGQGVITIADNADLPTIAVNDATASEAAAAIVFILTKTGTTLQPATVNYTINDGSATSSNDYTTASGTVTFTTGQTQAFVTIAVTNDAIFEGTETLTLDLATPVNATISDAQGIGTLTNDDAAPTISINDVTANEEDGIMVFTVSKAGSSAVATTVNYATGNNTATSSDDFIAASGTLTFTANQTQAFVTVIVTNDAIYEGTSSYFLNLSGAANGTITDAQGLGTINDEADLPSFAGADVTIAEDVGAATINITLSGASTQNSSISYSVAAGSASGLDVQLLSGGFNFSPFFSPITVPITPQIFDDNIYEANETFVVNLTSATNATISDNQIVVTIVDNDAAPVFAISDATANEEAGTLIFTVSKTGNTALTATVQYATADGTALSVSDYSTQTGTLTFTAGQTQSLVTLTITNNAIYEGNETFALNLSSAVNATIGDNQGIATIIDNTDLPSFAVSDAAAAAEFQFNVFTITKTGQTLFTSTIDFSTSDGSATSSNDYISQTGTLTFTTGQTQILVSVTLTNDLVYEGNETFLLNLSNPVNAQIGDNQGVATIDDISDFPNVTLLGTGATENGQSMIFTIVSSLSVFSKIVDYTTVDGAATAANDYIATSGTITILPSETQTFITVPITNDAVYEGAETFSMHLSNPVNTIIGLADEIATINPDEPGPVFSISDVSANESAGAMIFTWTRINILTVPSTITYSTINFSATSTNDYVSKAETITFGVGETQILVTVTITDDNVFEADETFQINANNVVNGGFSFNTAIGTILNDDSAPSFAINDVTQSETAGTFIFTVTKTGATAFASSVNYTTANGTALSASDYIATSGTLTFTAGQTQALITVTITNDAITEGDETFAINLSGAVNATISDNQGVGTISIEVPNILAPLDTPSFNNTTGGFNTAGVLGLWQTFGVSTQAQGTYVYTTVAGSVSIAPAEGAGQLRIVSAGQTQVQLENSLNLTTGTLDSFGLDVANGAAATTNIFAQKGDSISFQWNMANVTDVANITAGLNDLAIVLINGVATELSRLSNFASLTSTGWQTYSFIATETGLVQLGFAVLNVLDNNLDSGLSIDNVQVNSIPLAQATPIPLNLEIFPSNQDGSETITSITISGVPAGASLSNGTDLGGGSWLLTQAQLDNLTLIPTIGFSGTINLNVSATSTETATLATATLTSAIQIDVSNPDSVYLGTTGSDNFTGNNQNNYIYGSDNNDTLNGDLGHNIVHGGNGNDVVTVASASDHNILLGNAGNDTLTGGSNNDLLYGGKGADILTGGNGHDVFVWEGGDEGTIITPAVDTITDFDNTNTANGDQINLADLLQGATTNNLTSYLHFAQTGADTTVSISPTGGGLAAVSQQIVIQGIDLTAGWTLSDGQIIQNLFDNNKLIINE